MTGKVANLSNYPNGFGGGVALDGLATHRTHSGKVFYVGGGSAGTHNGLQTGKSPSDGNKGTFNDPFKSLGFAVEQCVDARGDVVILLPGLVDDIETVVDIEAGNVTILGLGTGNDRPQLTPGILNALDVEGDNVTIQNVYFNEADTEIVTSIDVVGAGFRFLGNHMDLGTHDDNPITVTATGEVPVFRGNKFVVTADGTVAVVDVEGVVDNPVFIDNFNVTSVANYDQAFVDMEAVAVTNAYFEGNVQVGGGTELVATAAVGTYVVAPAASGTLLSAVTATANADETGVVFDVTGAVDIWGLVGVAEAAGNGTASDITVSVEAAGGGGVLWASTEAIVDDEMAAIGDMVTSATAGGSQVGTELGEWPDPTTWPSPVRVTATSEIDLTQNGTGGTGVIDFTIFYTRVSGDGLVADE